MTESDFWNKGFHYLIVSLIFLGLAIKLIWSGGQDIAKDLELQNWQKIEARVSSVNVEPVYEYGSVIGNRLLATYSYSISGKDFTSNKVAIDPTFSNSPEELLLSRKLLENAIADNKTVQAMVDPNNPENSWLFRPFPFKAFFLVLLGAVMLGIYILLEALYIFNLRHQTLRSNRKKQFPDRPWRWEESWQSFSIPAESQLSKSLPLFAFSTILFVFSLTLVVLVILQPGKGVEEFSGIAFLALFNLMLLYKCLKKWRGETWAKSIELQASSFPVRPGEKWPFRIIVEQPRDMEILAQVKIFVKYFRSLGTTVLSGTGRGGSYAISLAEKGPVEDGSTCFALNPEVKSAESKILLELAIELPEDCETTNLDDEFPGKWQVLMHFNSNSKEFIETFDIPVYPRDKFSLSEENNNFIKEN